MPKIFKDKNNNILYTGYETSEVVANPTLVGTEANLTGLQIGDTKYKVSEGSGGGLGLQYLPIKDVGDAMNYIASFEEIRYIDVSALYNLLVAKNYDLNILLEDCTFELIIQGNYLEAAASFTPSYIGGALKITFTTSGPDVIFTITDIYDTETFDSSVTGLTLTNTLGDFFQYLISSNRNIPININREGRIIGIFNPVNNDYSHSPTFGNIYATNSDILQISDYEATYISANEFKALKYTPSE